MKKTIMIMAIFIVHVGVSAITVDDLKGNWIPNSEKSTKTIIALEKARYERNKADAKKIEDHIEDLGKIIPKEIQYIEALAKLPVTIA